MISLSNYSVHGNHDKNLQVTLRTTDDEIEEPTGEILEVIEDTSTVSVESPAGEVSENRLVTQALLENARDIFSIKYDSHKVEHINIKFY